MLLENVASSFRVPGEMVEGRGSAGVRTKTSICLGYNNIDPSCLDWGSSKPPIILSCSEGFALFCAEV